MSGVASVVALLLATVVLLWPSRSQSARLIAASAALPGSRSALPRRGWASAPGGGAPEPTPSGAFWPGGGAFESAQGRDAMAGGGASESAPGRDAMAGGGASESAQGRDATAGGGALDSGRWRGIWHEDPVELVRAWRLRRRPQPLVDALLDVLDGVGPALHAGLAPGRALELAASATLGPQGLARGRAVASRSGRSAASDIERLVGAALDAVETGQPASVVLADWAGRSGSADLAYVAAAWRLAETTGCPLATAVERAAQGLRDARTRRGKVAVAVAGPKATVTVLTVLPLTGPLFGLACGVDPASLYSASALSVGSLILGLALIWLGRLWCARMIRTAVR